MTSRCFQALVAMPGAALHSDTQLRDYHEGCAGGRLSLAGRLAEFPLHLIYPSVPAGFTLRGGDETLLGEFTRTWAPREAFQLSPNIFELVGAGSVVTSNAYLVVTATAPVYPYVTVVDNVSGDTSWLPVSDDESEP